DPRAAAVGLDDAANDRQADAGALDPIARVQGLEQIPDPRVIARRDPRPVVAYVECPAVARGLRADLDERRPAGVVLERVADEVHEYLLQRDARGVQRRQQRIDLDAGAGGDLEQLDHLADQRAGI